MSKILITGGSGFIGTNLVEYLNSKEHQVINFDIKSPKNKAFLNLWVKGDILIESQLKNCIENFQPEYVIHLAARTDLLETKNINGYNSNIDGVKNIVSLINENKNIKRVVYASSRMVCKIDYIPKNFEDYCPPNLYGKSKMIGEKIVKQTANHDYVIVRPTSIWGPWFEIPYRTFFDTIKKGLFFLPNNHNPKKSFGFVLNTVFQIEKMLFAPKSDLEQCYYLTDYPALNLKEWSSLINKEFGIKKTPQISLLFLKSIALLGDLLKKTGWKNPPLTTFRLNNLITDMVYDTSNLEKLCGELPYNLEQGVDITVEWMKKDNQ